MSEPETMVERVSRAICDTFESACQIGGMQIRMDRSTADMLARVAVAAMRYPGRDIINAGDAMREKLEGPHPHIINDSGTIFNVMIDAALAPEKTQ